MGIELIIAEDHYICIHQKSLYFLFVKKRFVLNYVYGYVLMNVDAAGGCEPPNMGTRN